MGIVAVGLVVVPVVWALLAGVHWRTNRAALAWGAVHVSITSLFLGGILIELGREAASGLVKLLAFPLITGVVRLGYEVVVYRPESASHTRTTTVDSRRPPEDGVGPGGGGPGAARPRSA